jgi:hypothetical protein
MKFYIELSNTLRLTRYRLTEEGIWKPVQNDDVNPGDRLFDSLDEVIRIQKINEPVILDGAEHIINSTEALSFGGGKPMDTRLYYRVFVNREEAPKEPTLRQLISAIGYGDDRFHNSLILNIYGFFELRNPSIAMFKIIDPTIVVKYETFIKGNNYVGSESAMSEEYTDKIFDEMMKGWRSHLMSGITNIHISD